MTALSKTDAPGYLKDESTGLVVNQNLDEYHLLRARRKRGSILAELEKRLARLEERVMELEGRDS